jgi:hypothetical protein
VSIWECVMAQRPYIKLINPLDCIKQGKSSREIAKVTIKPLDSLYEWFRGFMVL